MPTEKQRKYDFKYLPLSGSLPGNEFKQQTEKAFNEIGTISYESKALAETALEQADSAAKIAYEAQKTANEAQTAAGMVSERVDELGIKLDNVEQTGAILQSDLTSLQNELSDVRNLATLAENVANDNTAALVVLNESLSTMEINLSDISQQVSIVSAVSTGNQQLLEKLSEYTQVSEAFDLDEEVDLARLYIENTDSLHLPVPEQGLLDVDMASVQSEDNADDYILVRQQFLSLTDCSFYFRKGKVTEIEDVEEPSVSWSDWENISSKAAGMPVGTIMLYPAKKLPPGFMACDGSYLSRTAYKDLFAVLGTVYGEGGGIDTFNLPDLRGYFVRGLDEGKGLDHNRVLGSVQGDAIRNLAGQFSNVAVYKGYSATGICEVNQNPTLYHFPDGETIAGTTLDIDASRVVPTAEENRPQNIALIYAIKVFGTQVNEGEIDISELAGSVAELTNTLQQPVGSVLAYAGQTPPAGYLVCNGSELGRETYPDLFKAIGTTYGVGDGTNTFNLPDLRGVFLRGVDLERGLDSARQLGSYQEGSTVVGDADKSNLYQIHTPSTVPGNLHKEYSWDKFIEGTSGLPFVSWTGKTNATSAGVDIYSNRVGEAYAGVTRPRNVAVLYCIKAFGSKINPGQVDLTALANEISEGRKKLKANLTVYVRPDGNNVNSGLTNNAQGAFCTISEAYYKTIKTYDFSGYSLTIQVEDGQYNEAISLDLQVAVGLLAVNIVGSGENCKINGHLHAKNNGVLNITNIKFLVENHMTAVYAYNHAKVLLSGNLWFIGSNGRAIFCTAKEGIMSIDKAVLNIKIDNVEYVFLADFTSSMHINYSTINILSPLCVILFAYFRKSFLNLAELVFTGQENVSGPKYLVDCNGVIYTYANEDYLPCSVAGIAYTGGVYV